MIDVEQFPFDIMQEPSDLIGEETPDHIDPLICPECKIEGLISISGSSIVCGKCGMWREIQSDRPDRYIASTDHNTSKSAFMSFKFVGPGSTCYQKSLTKHSSNYNKYSKNQTIKLLRQLNQQSKGVNFSEQIIIDVADLYEQIRLASDDFYRKDTKLGILAGCLYFVCHRHGITKRHSTIANMMGVNDKFAAKGEGIIRGLVDEKRIFVETQIDTIHDFAKQYMAALEIDLKYLPFVTDLIKQADHMGLHYTYEPKPTTKCASAIYMLVVRKKMTIAQDGEVRPISKEDISQECMISVTTFMRYYKILYDNHERIEKVFNKHRIPKPVEWRRNRKRTKKTSKKPKL